MRKSKARIVIELSGPTEGVEESVAELVEIARTACRRDVQANYPEPVRIESVRRNRKKVAPKPERKARKANSQQPEAAPTEANLSA